ncbi:MAG: DNA recombination protein RmuC [Firmicutes bacterium]|nr:DNA recombination protein RmuC [Bacillota bacterium]
MEWLVPVLLGILILLEAAGIYLMTRRGQYREFVKKIRSANQKDMHELRMELSKDSADEQARITQSVEQSIHAMERQLMSQNHDLQEELLKQNHETQEQILLQLVDSVQTMTRVNSEKLGEIQRDMRDKLDRSLNERLDSSFDKIGQQLQQLYQTVGELQTLSSGVDSLNRTLSNVKTRGTWGEMQLEQILANIFPENLYVKNAQVKEGSQERVEFALRIPDKTEGNQTILLPIDSKFPVDVYNKIMDASQKADARALEGAVAELRNRVRSEAKDISSKYINPPLTTDFAIMFLPTEGLYSEVLRIPGLAETCQKEYKVLITGPTTVSALLSSLAVGFRFLTVSRNTREVLGVLQNIRSQYEKFGDLIERTQHNLDLAVRNTEDMKKRSDMIQKRLSSVNILEESDEGTQLAIDISD